MQKLELKNGIRVSVHFSEDGADNAVVRFGVLDRYEDRYCYGRLENGGTFCCHEVYVFTEGETIDSNLDQFKAWVTTTDEYTVLLSNYGSNLFNHDMGVFRCLPIRLAYKLWTELNTGVLEA